MVERKESRKWEWEENQTISEARRQTRNRALLPFEAEYLDLHESKISVRNCRGMELLDIQAAKHVFIGKRSIIYRDFSGDPSKSSETKQRYLKEFHRSMREMEHMLLIRGQLK
jgi:hypothetical protein